MNLNLIILDAAGGLIVIPIFFILHLIITLFVEGEILFRYLGGKRNNRYLQALMINLASLIVGMFLFISFDDFSRHLVDFFGLSISENYFLVLLFFILTIVIEWLMLKLLNQSLTFRHLFKPLFVMNISTYALLAFFLYVSKNLL